MSKFSAILLVLLVLMVLALVFALLTQISLEANQEDWVNKKVAESATFIIPKETNIRKYPTVASSDEDNAELIISNDREYTWFLNVDEYYKTTDYFDRVWYGVAADKVNLDDCPKALAKWCKKHPDLIFWFSVSGGAKIG